MEEEHKSFEDVLTEQLISWRDQREVREENMDMFFRSREIDHFLSFTSSGEAEAAESQLKNFGYTVISNEEEEGAFVLHVTRRDNLLDETVEKFLDEVIGIALTHQGQYDGWGGPIIVDDNAVLLGLSRFVSFDHGRLLHYQLLQPVNMKKGSQAPVFLFVSSLGESRLCWSRVHIQTGKLGKSVIYDRAGLGRSTPPKKSAGLYESAADLCALAWALDSQNIFLIAELSGSVIAQLAVEKHPELFKQLILLEPNLSSHPLWHAPETLKVLKPGFFGLVKNFFKSGRRNALKQRATALPLIIQQDYIRENNSFRVFSLQANEMYRAALENRELAGRKIELHSKPVTIIIGSKPNTSGDSGWDAARSEGIRQFADENAAIVVEVIESEQGSLNSLSSDKIVLAELKRLVGES